MGHARHWILGAIAIALAFGGWTLLDDRDGTAGTAVDADGRPAEVAGSASRGTPGPANALFRIEPGFARVPGSGDDSVPVTISREAALAAGQAGSITAALPDGTRYPVRYERSESAPDGNWTFVGRVDTPLGALASVITFGKDGVFGTLPTPGGRMMKLTTRAGQAFLQPAGFVVPPGVDPSKHPDYLRPEPATPGDGTPSIDTGMPRESSAATAPSVIGQRADDDGGEVTITILAVYTKNLSQLRGSRAAAETEYRNLVAVMNQAHIDSGTIARFEIAAFVETDYPAHASIAAAREDIVGTLPDGTNLGALRNQHSADLVAMIRPYVAHDLYCGISQFPGEDLHSHLLDSSTGYSVTAVEACRPIVFAHEIGHNLGLMHDRDTIAGPHGATLRYGTYRFSFGHRQLGPPGFATIMAYDSASRPRLSYFSHPGTTLCGGVACGDADLADNVRSTNLTAESISRFRDPPGVLFINDRWTYEASWGDSDQHLSVELSSPAPSGGVTFDVVVVGGSAKLGVDADVVSEAGLVGMSIPHGQTSASFQVRVRADDIPEFPETLDFRLLNVRGNVAVLDDDATLTIVDYDTPVRVEGKVRFPPGFGAKPDYVHIRAMTFNEGVHDEYSIHATAPHYRFATEVEKGAFVRLETSSDGLRMQDVIIENVDRPMLDVDLRFRAQVRVSGTLTDGAGQPVTGVPVILWIADGDGSGYYVIWLSDGYLAPYERDVMAGTAMQLEVRDPPWPYVRQVVEVPPTWAAGSWDIQLRQVPSLTIPHVTVTEGTAADGPRTILLTASLSVPGTETGVTFRIQRRGTADGHDVQLPQTQFSIPVGSSRVEVPVVIVGDDEREGDETIELRITGVMGAAWNPGPGSVRIVTDDGRPGAGSCTTPASEGAVRMCQ